MDILTNENIAQLGATLVLSLAIVLSVLVPLIRNNNKQNNQTITILDKLIQQSDERNQRQFNEMVTRTKECQVEFLNALQSVEKRHEHSIQTMSSQHNEKFDTIIEVTTILMQQNERLSNDANNIINILKVAENQTKLENKITEIEKAIKTKSNDPRNKTRL